MSNAETKYIESLSKESRKQKTTITVFSVLNTILLLGIIALVLLKTCACG